VSELESVISIVKMNEEILFHYWENRILSVRSPFLTTGSVGVNYSSADESSGEASDRCPRRRMTGYLLTLPTLC
jgi:hypothetical protein